MVYRKLTPGTSTGNKVFVQWSSQSWSAGGQYYVVNPDSANLPMTRAMVFYGPFEAGSRTTDQADVVLVGDSDRDWFGFSMATGDYDGDGIDDLAVSATYDSSVAYEAGAAYVLAGARPQ